MTSNVIKLDLIDDTTFCCSADDYMTIRTEHRIIGKLIGSSVKWPRNMSLNGIVQLCKKTFSDVPDEAIEKVYEKRCEEQIKTYHEIYAEKKVEDARKYMDKILLGKRKKAIKSGADPNEITEDAILNEARQRAISDVSNVLIQIPTQEPFDVDFEEVKTAPTLDPFKYKVYCDLYETGSWITSGETFGGDFLVYPNEPLYFHGSHIVHVLSEDEAKAMTSRTFITRSRLSVNVNKLCTFVFENKETKNLSYQTVQWLGK